jgi:hypothetical protein
MDERHQIKLHVSFPEDADVILKRVEAQATPP